MRNGSCEPGTFVRVGGTLMWKAKRGARLMAAVLREIFDESAYARFLARQNLVSSPAAYAAFQQHTEGVRMRRPRCC
jgi:hypothetical protein